MKILNPVVDLDKLSVGVQFEPLCSIAFGDLKPRLESETGVPELPATIWGILEAIERSWHDGPQPESRPSADRPVGGEMMLAWGAGLALARSRR